MGGLFSGGGCICDSFSALLRLRAVSSLNVIMFWLRVYFALMNFGENCGLLFCGYLIKYIVELYKEDNELFMNGGSENKVEVCA